MQRRLIVSVLGNAACCRNDCSVEQRKKWELSFELGKCLVDHGCRVLTGGGKGVMRATFAGAHASKNYKEGDTIAICPSYDFDTANDYADIAIPTGFDLARDIIVANSEVVIAMGGGAGTLNEISAAWKMGRMVIAYKNVDGWSSKLADMVIDDAERIPGIGDRVWGVESAEEAWALIEKLLPYYNKAFDRIPFGVPVLKDKAPSNWVGPVRIKSSKDVEEL
ncbi:MAG: acyl-CoA synthetase [Clostridia bacterium]|nr:acyl-CoA synthetase [Clostridia bacterium]